MSRSYENPYASLEQTAFNHQLNRNVWWQGGALQQQGVNLFKFDLSKGVRASFDPTSVDRMECDGGATVYPYGQEVWSSYSLRVWKSLKAYSSFMFLGQWHAVDNVSEPGRSPTFALRIEPNDVLKLETRHDDSLISNGNISPVLTTHYTDVLTRGSWDNWVFACRFELTTAGRFRAWRNGVQVADYTGRMGYNDPEVGRGNYWKFGVYRSSVEQRQIAQFANMEWGTTDLSSRISSPLPIPT